MKKSVTILLASTMILFSGCVCHSLDYLEPVETKNVQEAYIIQASKVKPSKVTDTAVMDVIADTCKSCKDSQSVERCSELVKTIIYKSSCSSDCSFPVSIRIPTSCRGDI
ncbi:MAG: hypothetical protein COB17_09805 [Sulfurimonas sp.]|nr:MAG: hypothetical protein COB17_09805 [Sulfurimonas sp.]